MSGFCRALMLVGSLLVAATTSSHAAQLDTIELSAKDPAATAKWYASNFGGKLSDTKVVFGDITLTWKKVDDGTPLPNPAIASLGFSVKNAAEKLDALKKSNVKVLKDLHRGAITNWANVADPDGMNVGILEDSGNVGLHHILLNAPLLARRDTLRWYAEVVGGDIRNFKGAVLWTGVSTNNVWVAFADELPGDSKGKVYNTASMTWRVDDVGPAKKIQKSRKDSSEELGKGLVVVDPCGLPVRFIEDPKAKPKESTADDAVTSGEIKVGEEQYKMVKDYKGTFKLEVVRVLGEKECTLGQLFVNNVAFGYILELPWNNNKPTISDIPAGTYNLSLHYDTKHRMRLHVENVPGRAGIQMHIGSTPDDTQGCVLFGTGISAVSCTLTNTREAAARLRRAYSGSSKEKDPSVMKLDRPAILVISDSIASADKAPATSAPPSK